MLSPLQDRSSQVYQTHAAFKESSSITTARRIGYSVSFIFMSIGIAGSVITGIVMHSPGHFLFCMSISVGGGAMITLAGLMVWGVIVTLIEFNSETKDKASLTELDSRNEFSTSLKKEALKSSITELNNDFSPIETHKNVVISDAQHLEKKSYKNQSVKEYLRLNGSKIQKRNYYHLLTPYIDTLLRFYYDNDSCLYDPLDMKIRKVKEFLQSENFCFVFEETVDEGWSDFKKYYYQFVRILLSLENEEILPIRRRYDFIDALNHVIVTQEYKTVVEKICNDEVNEIDASLYMQVRLILEITATAWTDVSVNSLSQDAVPYILKDGYPKVIKKNVSAYFDRRGEPLANGEDIKFFKMLGLPTSLIKSSTINLAHTIACDFQAILASSKKGSKTFKNFHSLRGYFNVAFWPLMINNFPSILWQSEYLDEDGEKFTIRCARLGTPTSQNKGSPVLLPFFLSFLDMLKINQQRVISFQLQNPKKKITGNENSRLNLMFQIPDMEDKKYFKTYFPIGLAMTGEWYNQTGKYGIPDLKTELFIEEYLEYLTNPNKEDAKLQCSPYNINWKQFVKLGIRKSNVKQDLKTIFSNLHALYFGKRDSLNHEERKIFITVSYVFIEEYFVLLLEGAYYENQCKDGQDRTMLIFCLKYWRDMVRSHKIHNPSEREKFRCLVHFAGLFIKGAPMHGTKSNEFKGHAKRCLEVLNFLENQHLLQPQLNEEDQKITVLEEEFKFLNSSLVLTPNQCLNKIPSEAKTIDEYQKILLKDKESSHTAEFSNYFMLNEDKESEIGDDLDNSSQSLEVFLEKLKNLDKQDIISELMKPKNILQLAYSIINQYYGHEGLGIMIRADEKLNSSHSIINFNGSTKTININFFYNLNLSENVQIKDLFIKSTASLSLLDKTLKIQWSHSTKENPLL